MRRSCRLNAGGLTIGFGGKHAQMITDFFSYVNESTKVDFVDAACDFNRRRGTGFEVPFDDFSRRRGRVLVDGPTFSDKYPVIDNRILLKLQIVDVLWRVKWI